MTSRRYLPALLFLFIGSGCAALVYEIVWFQLLQLAIGSSAISLGILLGTFMGGMCLGSLLLPRLIPAQQHPLRIYGLIELGIGVLALFILWGMPLVGGVYTARAGTGVASIVLRAVAATICLVPPTMLMGATLPAISRWVKATPEGVSWLGFFYGGNIGGGVAGSLLAGFYLLRLYDIATTTFVAVAINAVVGLTGWLLAGLTAYEPQPVQGPGPSVGRARSVHIAIGLSGMTALAAEVIWTRILSLHFGATVYAFSLILAVFLVGLGLGSAGGSVIARETPFPSRALGWCQLLLCGAIAWAAYMNTESLPYWPTNPSIATSPWFTLQLDLARCFWVVLPAAILWGASFPLALASGASSQQDAARLAAGMYASNTVGAIVGALGASFILIPWIGTSHSQQGLIVISALSALLLLEPEYAGAAGRAADPPLTGPRWSPGGTLVLVVAMIAAGLLARSVHALPGLLVAYGRYAATRVGQADVIYVGEGLNAAVAVSQLSNGVLNYHNAGKVQASSEPQDMRLQRMLGHLTTLVPARPRRVVVIGCGAGVTAGAVSIDPAVEQETIVEIEPLVPRVVSKYFSQYNFDVVRNPKVHVEIDDARHFIQNTRQTFDAVTSDPLDPWVK
jgi:spermidine synthase